MKGLFRVWLERPLPSQYAHLLAGIAEVIGAASDTPEAPLSALPGAHAVIASARVRYDGAFMDRFPTVRVISRTGIGLDNISLPDATAHGVAVCYAPDGPTISTAEHAVALMLAAARRLKQCERDLLERPVPGDARSEPQTGSRRDFFNDYQGLELCGRCLGLVGLGRIGSRVARVALALEMRVLAFDPWIAPAQAEALGVQLAPSLEALLSQADVVSLHAPLTAETQGLMNAERLAQMKPGAYLINTARGGLVDEDALLAALEAGHLAGAGLDVFAQEPPDPDSPLLQRVDVVATPHIAGATAAGRDRLWRAAITQALQVLQGIRPPHLANPEVWPARKPQDLEV